MLNLEDRIQTRVQEIYNVDLFPAQINLSEQTPLDFVCVGCGPLSFNSDFVGDEPPANILKNNLLFMAKKMGLLYPVPPSVTKKEFGMIKGFLKNCPQPKEYDIKRLCKMFKAAADGVEVFLKIPPLIKPVVKKWKLNQEIVCYVCLQVIPTLKCLST